MLIQWFACLFEKNIHAVWSINTFNCQQEACINVHDLEDTSPWFIPEILYICCRGKQAAPGQQIHDIYWRLVVFLCITTDSSVHSSTATTTILNLRLCTPLPVFRSQAHSIALVYTGTHTHFAHMCMSTFLSNEGWAVCMCMSVYVWCSTVTVFKYSFNNSSCSSSCHTILPSIVSLTSSFLNTLATAKHVDFVHQSFAWVLHFFYMFQRETSYLLLSYIYLLAVVSIVMLHSDMR